ncbi:MAG: glycosyltransferase, partial [Solirubrobacteraceae bacterium]
LTGRARLRGVTCAVHFLGPTDAPLSALRGATVFVMASWRESFPYVVLEAMSAGLPIVSTDVGGVREAITDGRDGMLVAPADPAGLARATVAMLDDGDLRIRLGAAARDRVEREFTRQKMLAGLSDLYTQIPRSGAF